MNSAPPVMGDAPELMRPKERVLHYFTELLKRVSSPNGNRLPTTRSIAQKLGVSPATVQSVFHDFARQGIIRTEVGNGSFLMRSPAGVRPAVVRVGITFGFADQPKRTVSTGICVMSTALAEGVVKHCQEAAIPFPEACSLIVATGVDNHVRAGYYTRISSPTDKMGRALLKMLLGKIGQHGTPQPGIYLRGSFLRGESTLPEEHALLKVDA